MSWITVPEYVCALIASAKHRLMLVGLLAIVVPGHTADGTPARIEFDTLLKFGANLGEFPALSGDAGSVAILHSPTGPNESVRLEVRAVDGSTLVRRFEFFADDGPASERPEAAVNQARNQVEEANAYLSAHGFLVMQPLYILHRSPTHGAEEFLNDDRRILWSSDTGELVIGTILVKPLFSRNQDDDPPFVPSRYDTNRVEFAHRWPVRESGRVGTDECEGRRVPVAGWVNLDQPPERSQVLVLRVTFELLSDQCDVPDEWVVASLWRNPNEPSSSAHADASDGPEAD